MLFVYYFLLTDRMCGLLSALSSVSIKLKLMSLTVILVCLQAEANFDLITIQFLIEMSLFNTFVAFVDKH